MRAETNSHINLAGGGGVNCLTVITDAIAEMKWWASFSKAEKESPKQAQAHHAASAPTQAPKVHNKPWRNAPCPCGSGKKYKHCCGKQ